MGIHSIQYNIGGVIMLKLELVKVTKTGKETERRMKKALTSNCKKENIFRAGCYPVSNCSPHEYCCPDTGWR